MLELITQANIHWYVDDFERIDPHLRRFNSWPIRYAYPFDVEFEANTPGIYLLSGGRQLGKTTSLKKLIDRLIRAGQPPKNILYFPCDAIRDRFELYNGLRAYLTSIKTYQDWVMGDIIRLGKDPPSFTSTLRDD